MYLGGGGLWSSLCLCRSLCLCLCRSLRLCLCRSLCLCLCRSLRLHLRLRRCLCLCLHTQGGEQPVKPVGTASGARSAAVTFFALRCRFASALRAA